MEPQTNDPGGAGPGRIHPGSIVGGLILLAFGLVMLVDRTGLIQVRAERLLAPAILIALGAAMTLDHTAFVSARRERRERLLRAADERLRRAAETRRGGMSGGGLWLMCVGVWMMISELHMFGLTYATSWPIFIIAMGLLIVVRAWQ